MPCTLTGSLEGDHILSLSEDAAKTLTATAQAACEMGKLLTPAQRAKLSPKTRAWLTRHEKIDAKRTR